MGGGIGHATARQRSLRARDGPFGTGGGTSPARHSWHRAQSGTAGLG
ncbi:hypothetical protein MKK88_28555 [Methylobacterium sp. E-005]|nr:hypothetical protein [Methylobacterium sp. E-005]MCJ2089909.1 hypothetical protein [Methylobacterium sp. E-005]